LQLQTQAPDYESLIDILSMAGQDEHLIMFIEGLMYRQIAVDRDNDAAANALQQSSQMWQNLYQCLQSGMVFVKRRPSAPSFKLATRAGTSMAMTSGHGHRASISRKSSLTNKLLKRRSIDLQTLARRSSWSMGISADDMMTSRRPSIDASDDANVSGASSRRGSVADGQHGRGVAADNLESSSIEHQSQQHRLQRRRGSVSLPS
jgi:hypothetical protein